MKGIILAGGKGTRLRPLTTVTSKQLLPIYNKPMIFFPLETLINAGIKDILIIVAPDHAGDFLKLLGSGKEFGCDFSYEVQEEANGLAQALVIGEQFIQGDNVALILGDNLFEDDFSQQVKDFESGAIIFGKEVPDPERFGIIEVNEDNTVLSIEEKPSNPKSPYAQTGFFIYDSTVAAKAKSLQPSGRGEYEITDLNNLYLQEGTLKASFVDGQWLDTGTFEAMYQAVNFVRDKHLRSQ